MLLWVQAIKAVPYHILCYLVCVELGCVKKWPIIVSLLGWLGNGQLGNVVYLYMYMYMCVCMFRLLYTQYTCITVYMHVFEYCNCVTVLHHTVDLMTYGAT